MAIATTTTTTLSVTGMTVIAAGKAGKALSLITANLASVSTAKVLWAMAALKSRRVNVGANSSKLIKTVTTKTTTLRVTGTEVTAVARTLRKLTAKSANAKIAISRGPRTPVLRLSKANASCQVTKKTATAMTGTITRAVIGMVATAVVTMSKQLTAQNASAKIAPSRRSVPKRGLNVVQTNTEKMAIVTMITITVPVAGTVVTAVVPLSRRLTAKCASVWIQVTNPRSAASPSSRAMATVTMKIIVKVVNLMAVTAVAMSRRLTAKCASVWIQITSQGAAYPSSRAMATVTMKIILKLVNLMAVTAVVHKSSRPIAKCVNVSTRNTTRNVKENAATRFTRAMVTATITTTIAAANTMAVIAVPKL